MNCPACDSPLEERTVSDIRLAALHFITPSYYIPDDQEWGAY